MIEEPVSLRYSGGTVARGDIDAYEVAEAIRGFGDFLQRISRELYGRDVKLRTRVRQLQSGSIEIQFLQIILDDSVIGALLSAQGTPLSIVDLLKEVWNLIKFLSGKPARAMRSATEGGVYIENNNGDVQVFNNPSVNIVVDSATGNAVRKFVQRPLRSGTNNIEVFADSKKIAEASRDEADCFVPINADKIEHDIVVEMTLSIATAVLEGRSKWRFSDGTKTFSASIQDENFLQDVDEGVERFGKGDFLQVRLRTIQKRTEKGLSAEYIIEQVIGHEQKADEQIQLL